MKKYILRIIPNNQEVAQWYESHSYYNDGDSGIDLFCSEDIIIKVGETKKIKFDISCEIICIDEDKQDTYNVSYLLLPRSSIIKTPLRMANSVGLIDAHYQNNICAFVDNIKQEDYEVKKGSRLFQLVVPSLKPIHRIEVVKQFMNPHKNRGGGFGSTN